MTMEISMTEDQTTLHDLIKTLMTAFANADPEAFASVFEENGECIFRDGQYLKGKLEIAETHQRIFSSIIAREPNQITQLLFPLHNDRVKALGIYRQYYWHRVRNWPISGWVNTRSAYVNPWLATHFSDKLAIRCNCSAIYRQIFT